MGVSAAPSDGGGPAPKRPRSNTAARKPGCAGLCPLGPQERSWLAFGPHPQGVRPLGNVILDATRDSPPSTLLTRRASGLGNFAVLSDELLLLVLGLLPAAILAQLGAASRVCYAFTRSDELWRALVLERCPKGFWFAGSWHATYVLDCRGTAPNLHETGLPSFPVPLAPASPSHDVVPIRSGLYSDVLFRPWQCAAAAVGSAWAGKENVARRSSLSVADFINEYERPNRPVVITDVVKHWPAFQQWTRDRLLEVTGSHTFEAGPVELRLDQYFQYADRTRDESPLYLFDPRFADKCPSLASDYTVPEYFAEDLFALLGPTGRPDYRWLIVGPARSGSTFHIDPNGTSAWNAVISGQKKWIMFPPHVVPPGVHPSVDGAEVTSPESLAEWFLTFYNAAKAMDPPPIEFVAKAGDLVFVPHGWWHLVMNLTDSIAITQNYVNRQNLLHVLHFLKHKPAQVSGLAQHYSGSHPADLYDRFSRAFEAAHPGELERMRQAAKEGLVAKDGVAPSRSFWSQVRNSDSTGTMTGAHGSQDTRLVATAAFRFDFAGEGSEDGDDGDSDDGEVS